MIRLLERTANGDLAFASFDEEPPEYAILSHTWGAKDQEVTFQDVKAGVGQDKIGYTKIQFIQQQATAHGLRYFWIDTCCIDRTDSVELSEAIISMFRWYKKARRCYVFLSDVSTGDEGSQLSPAVWEEAFSHSRWFTRGWTLQELIAPTSVEFFSMEGTRFGDKKTLENLIQDITTVSVDALRGCLDKCSISDRLIWSAGRETTRIEDKAYCLQGIFGVNIAPMYGEKDMAYIRLWEEIMKTSRSMSSLLHIFLRIMPDSKSLSWK
jgi:hypothetical protein